jgi:hypothetical protein
MFRRIFHKTFVYDAKNARDMAFYSGRFYTGVGGAFGVYLFYTQCHNPNDSAIETIRKSTIPLFTAPLLGSFMYVSALFYPLTNAIVILTFLNGAGVALYDYTIGAPTVATAIPITPSLN